MLGVAVRDALAEVDPDAVCAGQQVGNGRRKLELCPAVPVQLSRSNCVEGGSMGARTRPEAATQAAGDTLTADRCSLARHPQRWQRSSHMLQQRQRQRV